MFKNEQSILFFFFSNIHINLFITFIEGKNSQNKEKRKKKNSFEKKKIFFTFSITYFFFPSHSLSLTPSDHIVQMLQLSIWMRKISHFRFVIKGSNYDSFASIRLLEDSVVLFQQLKISLTGLFQLVDGKKLFLGVRSNCFGDKIYFLKRTMYSGNLRRHCHVYLSSLILNLGKRMKKDLDFATFILHFYSISD